MITLQFPCPHPAITKYWKGGHFTNLLKWKYLFRERECVCVCVKEGPISLLQLFLYPLAAHPVSPVPAHPPVCKGWVLFDLCVGIFDLLISLGQDTLFAWGTGYMEAGRGMGNIPSLVGSEQPRLLKVEEGTLQWALARDFGLHLLEGGLEAYNTWAIFCATLWKNLDYCVYLPSQHALLYCNSFMYLSFPFRVTYPVFSFKFSVKIKAGTG